MLIISPYFAPSNAADMQRVRMSLPYFREFGWEVEVVCVDEKHSEMVKDNLLLKTLPPGVTIHKVGAFDKSWTGRLGLGSLALRSMWFYRQKVNEILRQRHFNLIYFSTTQFPVSILGRYWKRKFNVPYVIDMQDPWHSYYYQDKPRGQRPRKYWFSYRLHKYLEPVAMKNVDGLIAVSEDYISMLKNRYPEVRQVPSAVITFGAFEQDMMTAAGNSDDFEPLLEPGHINIVYAGRGGTDMHKAIAPVFEALKKGMSAQPGLFGKLRLYFIGTSYAPDGQGKPSILPLAEQYGVEAQVTEITGRIGYFHTLATLRQADALLIPGSEEAQYTASKIYPYLLTKKPLIAIFNQNSNAVSVLRDCTTDATILTFDTETSHLAGPLYRVLLDYAKGVLAPAGLTGNFEKYTARELTKKQAALFELAVKHHQKTWLPNE